MCVFMTTFITNMLLVLNITKLIFSFRFSGESLNFQKLDFEFISLF